MRRVFLILIGSLIVVALMCAFALPVEAGSERAICVTTAYQASANVDGSRVVWGDNRSGNYDIYMKDLHTGLEVAICTAPYTQGSPAISGDRIVWEDYRNGTGDIYMYDLVAGVETPICTNPILQEAPAIWGDRIVWMDYRNSGTSGVDIYMYDVVTGIESPVCTQAAMQHSPAIWGDRIVWQDDRNSGTSGVDIYMYDVVTGIETPICTQAGGQYFPAIWGDRIVWVDWRNGNDDIYMYDLATATESPVCVDAAAQSYPAICNDRIVWADYRNSGTGETDIYMYDLATATETPICTAAGAQGNAAICGDRIVWDDNRTGNYDIYMHKLATCSFDDVLRTHTFWRQIEAIFAHSVAEGTSTAPPMYSPAGVTTRGQMASFICRAFNLTWYDPGVRTFTDVPRGANGQWDGGGGGGLDADGTHVFYGYVERLKEKGVTGGIGGGLYGVTGDITRGQMAVFICKAAGKTPLVSPTPRFADVPSSHPFYGWIERLADVASWGAYGPPTMGTSPTTFSPAATCTRGHMAAFLQRAREFELPIR